MNPDFNSPSRPDPHTMPPPANHLSSSILQDPEDDQLLDSLAALIAKRGLTIPAVFFLETMKPLNFIGAQLMVFFGPFIETLIPPHKLYRFTDLMENRNNVEVLLRKLENLEDLQKQKEADSNNQTSPINSIKKHILQLWRKK